MIHSDYVAGVFLAQIKQFDKVFSGTVFPPFADPETQANKVAEDYWNQKMSEPVGEDGPRYDPGDVADDAHEKSIEFYETMHAMHQTVLNLFAAGVFHLFEQQLGTLLEDWNGKRPKYPFNELINGATFVDKSGNRTAFNAAPAWAKLDELRLVANVVKHAEGSSASDLRSVNDEYFKHPAVRGTSLAEHFGHDRMQGEPLSGEGMYVTKDDYDGLVAAVVAFWTWLADTIE